MDFSDIEWGTVGEWVSGLGALAAVAVAVETARRASKETKAVRDEQRDDREAAEADRKLGERVARAGALSWWLVDDTHHVMEGTPPALSFLDEGGPGLPNPNGDDARLRQVMLVNAGSTALHRVSVLGIHYEGGELQRPLGVLPPGRHIVEVKVPDLGSQGASIDDRSRLRTNGDVGWVEFDTGAGDMWRRHSDGRLEQAPDHAAAWWINGHERRQQ